VAKPKPKGDGWSVARPQVSANGDPAPTELVDHDEWIGAVATEDYIGQRADGIELSDVVVPKGRWSGVTFERLLATDVAFSDCDLSGFVLQDESSLRRASFTRCRLSGAVFAGAKLCDVSFTECSLDDANFRMAELERISFDDCPVTAADFYGAKITMARVTKCDLRGVTLSKASLTDVDLRTSQLQDIIGADALRGATVDTGQVVSLARSLALALELKVVDADADV